LEAATLANLVGASLAKNFTALQSHATGSDFSLEAELYFLSVYEWIRLLENRLGLPSAKVSAEDVRHYRRAFVLQLLQRVTEDWFNKQKQNSQSFLALIFKEIRLQESAFAGRELAWPASTVIPTQSTQAETLAFFEAQGWENTFIPVAVPSAGSTRELRSGTP
jgi:hypothetical protein